jgi:hypothetical protein
VRTFIFLIISMLATAASAQSADAVRSELAPGASEQAQTGLSWVTTKRPSRW